VSTTTKPVTHWAEVAVKSASMKDRGAWLDAAGSVSRAVPRAIAAR